MSKPHIPYAEFEFSFVRSSGPGGQNVNKVNSKAELRWNLWTSPSVNEDERARLNARLGNRLTKEGDLIVTSDTFRDQGRNKEEAIEKFYAMIEAALIIPKKRKKTKQSWSSKIKNRESKKKDSEKKKSRQKPRF